MSEQEKLEMLAQGRKGDKGEPGEQGPQGLATLSRSATLALAGVTAVVVVVVGCVLVLAFSSVATTHHGEQLAQHGEQLAQHSEQLAQKALASIRHHDALCAAITALAGNTAPAGNPAKNPARAYDQRQIRILHRAEQGLGCARG